MTGSEFDDTVGISGFSEASHKACTLWVLLMLSGCAFLLVVLEEQAQVVVGVAILATCPSYLSLSSSNECCSKLLSCSSLPSLGHLSNAGSTFRSILALFSPSAATMAVGFSNLPATCAPLLRHHAMKPQVE